MIQIRRVGHPKMFSVANQRIFAILIEYLPDHQWIFALLVKYLGWQINGYLRYIRYLRCWLKGCSKFCVPWIAIFASGYIPGQS